MASGWAPRTVTDVQIARAGNTVVVPFREEMAKRHLKVTGDLGRVCFLVRSLYQLIQVPKAGIRLTTPGIRPSQQRLDRRERATLRHRVQPSRPRLPNQVGFSSRLSPPTPGIITYKTLGTSTSTTSTSGALAVSPKPSPNTT
jgi:hypothetical protein